MLKLGVYQHYKGNEYQVIDVASDKQTGAPIVIYRALQGEHKLWTQPLARFVEEVDFEGYHGPRFTWIRQAYE